MNDEQKNKLCLIIGLFLIIMGLIYAFMFLGAKGSCTGELINKRGFWFCVDLITHNECVKDYPIFVDGFDNITFGLAK